MKNIACVKFAGYAAGGTEKHLQTIAMILSQAGYNVDYYYTNNAPFLNHWFKHGDNDKSRQKLVEDSGVNSIKVYVESKQACVSPFNWNNTDFWELFDENRYDILITARGGYPEYPFNLINKLPIIDTVHSAGAEGVDKKENIFKTLLICNWQAEHWIKNGGDANKIEIIPTFVSVPEIKKSKLRESLNIKSDQFVYGFHQRDDPSIFSSISLEAFKEIESEDTHFILSLIHI